MSKCVELALKGMGKVSPNPMVGCVIVLDNKIIGEGYHEQYGNAHAEVNAINSVQDKSLLKKSTLYVNLEPCSHYGKTPPCSLKIIQCGIPHVVIGTQDSFPKVAGGGIKMLTEAGVKVEKDVLKKECEELNKRFFTFHEKKRPYIILKWAESGDKFIDIERDYKTTQAAKISTQETQLLVHQMRAKESAILVGTNTAIKDNPSLTVRLCEGNNPVRLVIDKDLKIPTHYKLFDNQSKTIVFTEKNAISSKEIKYIKIDFSHNILPHIMSELYSEDLLSLIVEGGSELLNSFIQNDLWDEVQIETVTQLFLKNGVQAPDFNRKKELISEKKYGKNLIQIYKNQ